MQPINYFSNTSGIQKKYEALRAFFYENKKAADIADFYGYTGSSFYSLIRDFRKHLKENPNEDFFFKKFKKGRKPTNNAELNNLILSLRKRNFSTVDIVTIVNAKGYDVSYGHVYHLLNKEGFARLIRRCKEDKKNLELPRIKAPRAEKLKFKNERFSTNLSALLLFLPFIKRYKIDELINSSLYPQTQEIDKLSSILCFLALKLSNIRRYSADDLWCMDRGIGLFAGLNVLPKNAWFSSYSHRVTKEMNVSFLKALHKIWIENDLLSDTANLDFTTIPYWGDDTHLENNWSGKRNKALGSMLAVLAHDPHSGIIDYGNTDILHTNESAVVLEYLDFYKSDIPNNKLKYLIFDSKFTNYENLAKLDDQDIKFITIRRRGKNIINEINNIPKDAWKTIRVQASGNKKRTLKIYEQIIYLKGYGKKIRQIIITGNGKIKPAIIITNDFEIKVEKIVRKYSRRWLVEKTIAEQIEFFHLNRVSSSMVIKVDFDLTMTILAHNLFRLLAFDLGRYSHLSAISIFEKFIANSGNIEIINEKIIVKLKKKRDLPQILELMGKFGDLQYEWLENKNLIFEGASVS